MISSSCAPLLVCCRRWGPCSLLLLCFVILCLGVYKFTCALHTHLAIQHLVRVVAHFRQLVNPDVPTSHISGSNTLVFLSLSLPSVPSPSCQRCSRTIACNVFLLWCHFLGFDRRGHLFASAQPACPQCPACIRRLICSFGWSSCFWASLPFGPLAFSSSARLASVAAVCSSLPPWFLGLHLGRHFWSLCGPSVSCTLQFFGSSGHLCRAAWWGSLRHSFSSFLPSWRSANCVGSILSLV